MLTIRSRLVLLVIAVLLPGMLGVAWLIGATLDAERAAHARTLRETSRALSMLVDSELDRRAAVAHVLAQSRMLDDAPDPSAENLRGFDQQARRAVEGTEGWVELRGPGRRLVDTRLPPGTPASGAADVRLAKTPQVLPLVDAGGDAHAELIEPVQRDGRGVLNLVVALRPSELQRIVAAQRLPAGWIGAVLDSGGNVIARDPGGAAFVGRPASPTMRAALARGSEGLFDSVSIEGTPTVVHFSRSSRGWTFVIAMPRAQYAGLLTSAMRPVVLGALALLALALAGALWLSRRIAQPVRALKLAAVQMQAGQPVALHPTGIAECDDVARALAEAAATLQRGRSELERQVAEAVARTRQAEQRISQSQRVEALGRLTGGVAHDVNNLLGVISNSAHLIQRHATTPELQMPVAATLRAVEAGSRLTQHLLRVAGRSPVRPQAIELGSMLPEQQELLRTVLGRHVEIEIEVAPDTAPVRVDAGELELALINLALNARDAMTRGGALRLRAYNAPADDVEGLAPQRYVVISATDDGPGMARDLVEHVFEPFFTTKAVGKGTGLGLSQVRGFCEQAGGTARLTSTPGVGTTVSMLLPAYDPADGPPPPAPVPAAVPAIAGARVLLVEDDPELGGVTTALLQAHGAQVVRAADAAEALQRLASEPPFDAALSDVVMPGSTDGLALARQLRREHPALPVLLISGYVGAGSAVDDFVVLSKPCPPHELLAALHAAIAGARTRQPPR